jgi:hypothetical protein
MNPVHTIIPISLRPILILSYHLQSSDSSVRITLGYGLDGRSSRVRFLAGAGNFSLHHRVQNGFGAHPALYPVGTRGFFLWGVKLTTHLHLVPRSKNEWIYTSTPQYAFMAWCSVEAQGHLYLSSTKSRDSSVGIALGYGLDDRGFRVRLPAGAGNFSLNHRVQNGSGFHPTSYSVGTRDFFPGVKRPGPEADHSPPSSAEHLRP